MKEKKKVEVSDQGAVTAKGDRKSIADGAVFVLPIIATFAVFGWFLGFMSIVPGTSVLELTDFYLVNQAMKLITLMAVSGLTFALAGKLLETSPGEKVEKKVDDAVSRIPFVGAVYGTTKTTADTVLGGAGFGNPVKVDLGSMSLTGFETGNGKDLGKKMVFIPTSPNITSGFLVEIDEEWVRKTEESRTEAITRVLSAGFGARPEPEETVSEKQKEVRN